MVRPVANAFKVFPRVLGLGVFFIAACTALCFRSMPKTVLIPHQYFIYCCTVRTASRPPLSLCLPSKQAGGVQDTGRGHSWDITLFCFAWESYDKSTGLELNLVFGLSITAIPLWGEPVPGPRLTHGPQFPSQNTELCCCGVLHRLQCGTTCGPPSLE